MVNHRFMWRETLGRAAFKRLTNPKNAQLIFTTHDTNLLNANLFRRDQVWFTQKDSPFHLLTDCLFS